MEKVGSGDVALRNAMKRADQLRSQIAEDQVTIKKLSERVRSGALELRQLDRFITAALTLADTTQLSQGRPRNPDRREVSEKALEIIRALRRPLSRRDLYKRLTDAGVIITGKDPEMVLGTMLYRDDRIVRLRGFGYWPKNEVYDPAFYIPEHEQVIGATDTSPEPDDFDD